LREAKAKLSEIIRAAQQGESTVVTKHGQPAAKVIPVEKEGVAKPTKLSLIDYLRTMPAEIPIKRNRSRSRSVKF
jgi:prevent-host-death family protein